MRLLATFCLAVLSTNNLSAQEAKGCDVAPASGPFRIFSQIEPIRPAPQAPDKYPLGNDLALRVAGSADIHIANEPLVIRSSSAVKPGVQTVSVPSTAQLCPPTADCSIVIERDTAQEESIAPKDWSIAGSTQIRAKFVRAHPSGFHIEQVGMVGFETRQLSLNGAGRRDRPVSFTDRNNNPVITISNDTSGTWPRAGIQFLGVITGNNGSAKDLVIRENAATSRLRILNSSNTAQLLTVDDAGTADFYGPSMFVHGTLYASSIVVVNPQTKMEQAVVESSQETTVLSGIVKLDGTGRATVSLPASFPSTTKDYRYQLTPIGSFAPLFIWKEVQGSSFGIAGGKPGMRVSWQVTAVR